MRTVFLRRGLVALFAAAVSFGAITQAQAETLRIGYQKYGTLVLLKAKGTLEKRLAAQGVDVQWTEFPGGPQLLEGLNVGSIDYGVTGETPPVFAQAAGADLLYVAYEPPAPNSEAILVPKDAMVRTSRGTFVYVINPSTEGKPTSVRQVLVTTGVSADTLIQVIGEGLAAGQQVVTEGAERLRAFQSVAIIKDEPAGGLQESAESK